MTTNSAARPPALTQMPEWQALEAHAQKMRDVHLRMLFADDAQRGERLHAIDGCFHLISRRFQNAFEQHPRRDGVLHHEDFL